MEKISILFLIIMQCFNFGCSKKDEWLLPINEKYKWLSRYVREKEEIDICKNKYKKIYVFEAPFLDEDNSCDAFSEWTKENYSKWDYKILSSELKYEKQTSVSEYRIYEIKRKLTAFSTRNGVQKDNCLIVVLYYQDEYYSFFDTLLKTPEKLSELIQAMNKSTAYLNNTLPTP